MRGWLGLVAVAAAGLATGLWGVGGAGAKVAETFTTTFTSKETTVVTTITTPDTTTTGTTTQGTTTQTTPAPEFASFIPASGSPGTSIVIRGRGFTGTTVVRVNGTGASFTVDSDFSITASLPAGATTGPIALDTPGGTLTSTAPFVVTAVVPGQAVAYQIDPAHDGVQTDAALNPPFALRWKTTFTNATASYPLIVDGKVFVTTSDGNLYALDQADGHIVWSQMTGTYSFSGVAYDAGKVFLVNYNGLLRAFDATSGAQLWITQLPWQWSFTSPPTAAHGVVYTGGAGSGGTVYAVDELNGHVLATQSVMNGDHSSPSLSDTGVFVSYACNQAYGFSQTSLAPLWHYSTGCEGGGGKTTVYANGNVFTRDYFGNLILNALTGTLQSTYGNTSTRAAPAVDATSVYSLTPPTLYAQSLNGGQTRWTFNGDGNLTSAPIVIRTPTREVLVEGSSSGMLYALDAATGAQLWSTNVGGSIPAPDEHNAGNLTGLAAGNGLLVVPNGFSVSAYAGGGTGPTDTTPPTLKAPPGITVEATGASGAAVSYTVTATDPDDAPAQITLTCLPASGSRFALGTTTVTCNAHDAAGNNATPATFPVTVRDTTAPTIAPTANITVNATSAFGATVTYAPTATDLVDGNVPVTCTPASGSSFANGTTKVTCTAKDTRGNTASATFTVTVLSAAAQLNALKTAVSQAPELQGTTQKRLRDKLTNDLNQGAQSNLAKACKGLALFITDVQANTAPSGPITSTHSDAWIAAANDIRRARGC